MGEGGGGLKPPQPLPLCGLWDTHAIHTSLIHGLGFTAAFLLMFPTVLKLMENTTEFFAQKKFLKDSFNLEICYSWDN